MVGTGCSLEMRVVTHHSSAHQSPKRQPSTAQTHNARHRLLAHDADVMAKVVGRCHGNGTFAACLPVKTAIHREDCPSRADQCRRRPRLRECIRIVPVKPLARQHREVWPEAQGVHPARRPQTPHQAASLSVAMMDPYHVRHRDSCTAHSCAVRVLDRYHVSQHVLGAAKNEPSQQWWTPRYAHHQLRQQRKSYQGGRRQRQRHLCGCMRSL